MENVYKNLLQPASILTGTIIGAGVFSLPYVFLNAGLATGFFYLLLFGAVFILLYLFYADTVVRTPGEHRFVGYARMYLGKWGFLAALLIGLVQLFFVLTIFMILAPSFSRLLFGGDPAVHMVAFWAVGSLALLADSRRFARMESLVVGGVVLIMALVFFSGIGAFLASPVGFGAVRFSDFLAVGPILFALSGALAIPEVAGYFREAKIPISYLKRAVVLGGIVPMAAYGAFVLGVIGLSSQVSPDAVSGLAGSVPSAFLSLIGILGLLSLMGSYTAVGESIRRTIAYDFAKPGALGGIAAAAVPLLLYVAGFRNFIGAVSFVGSIFLPLEAMLIVAMWLKADARSESPSMLVSGWMRACIPVILLVFMIAFIYAIMNI